MKKIIQLTLLFSLLFGCNSLFHPEETSVSNIRNYDELITAVNGVYGKLSYEIATSSNQNFYYINYYGDDLTNTTPYYDGTGDSPTTYPMLSTPTVWKILYSVIASANNILSQYDLSTTLHKPTKEILGELLLIRAYCHFRLTRTYGRIPIVADNELSYTTVKASFDEIYAFVEHDLRKAASLLPESSTLARMPYETPHRSTAKAMLAEVYLSWAGYPANAEGKYALAAKEAGEVFDSAAYFGFGLLDDFADVWKQENLYNRENVFCLYYSEFQPLGAKGYRAGVNAMYLGTATHQKDTSGYAPDGKPIYSGSNGFTLAPNSSCYFQLRFVGTELQFFNTYPSNYRKEVTFLTNIYIPLWDPKPNGYIHIDHAENSTRVAYRKFFYDALSLPFNNYCPGWEDYWGDRFFIMGMSKTYLFRYAQTLLTYAEATARSGQLNDKAYECVNMIRRRANNIDLYSPSVYDLQPGLSAEAFADSVVQERAWELAGEPEGRWFDIVRLNMIKVLPILRDPTEGGPPSKFDESAYFLEIPQGDIDLNPNLGVE
jgi:starch-binding outer membrane protein, SusD/RagB family